MDPRTRAEFIAEFHARQGEKALQQRFCQYALDMLLDSLDERDQRDQIDPAFLALSEQEREDYLSEQGKRMGADLLLFVQSWGVTRLELVHEWRARRNAGE